VAQNIALPLREQLDLHAPLLDEITALKLSLVGLPADTGAKSPAELSGGMRKRAALARALALDPLLLFLDEPTAGLDPIAAGAFDALIRDLRTSLGLTVFMVTHDLDTLVAVCDRIAVLVDKRLIIGTMAELLDNPHPWIQEYFRGPRGRAALGEQAGRAGR
jgi:phospholipid/cholesterol/gamma-HCH transport system ATP-binding protein